MPGLGIIIPRNGPGDGPDLPPALHSAGVDGYSRRFVASTLTDGAVTSWTDRGSLGSPITRTSASVGPITKITDTAEYVRLDSTGGVASLADTAATIPGNQTVMAVIRVNSPSTGAANTLDYAGTRMARSASGPAQASTPAPGGAGFVSAGPTMNAAAWRFVLWHVPSVLLRSDAVESSTPSGTWAPAAAGTALAVYASFASSVARQTDVAEVIVWDSLLDSTEREAVRTAMKAEYSFLA